MTEERSPSTVQDSTPGPWHYYLDTEGYYAIGHSSEAHEPGDIAHVYIPGATDPEYDDHNEGLANARLIAAAPLLLEALKATASHGWAGPCWCPWSIAPGKQHTPQCGKAHAALAAAQAPETQS